MNSVIGAVNNIASGRYKNNVENTNKFQEVIVLEKAVEDMQQDISPRKANIKYGAQHDTLTGLFNCS
ncbi:hypothetical protein ACOJR9_10535 [Alteromonas sp. A081]|uniref:hypothetical protein n=1 Tax=Alteromonas sp. A081 TaxID=3410269 RepID=UPI003B981333